MDEKEKEMLRKMRIDFLCGRKTYVNSNLGTSPEDAPSNSATPVTETEAPSNLATQNEAPFNSATLRTQTESPSNSATPAEPGAAPEPTTALQNCLAVVPNANAQTGSNPINNIFIVIAESMVPSIIEGLRQHQGNRSLENFFPPNINRISNSSAASRAVSTGTSRVAGSENAIASSAVEKALHMAPAEGVASIKSTKQPQSASGTGTARNNIATSASGSVWWGDDGRPATVRQSQPTASTSSTQNMADSAAQSSLSLEDIFSEESQANEKNCGGPASSSQRWSGSFMELLQRPPSAAGDISAMASTSRGKKSNMKAPPNSSLSTATIGTNGIEDTISSGEESEANNVHGGPTSSSQRWSGSYMEFLQRPPSAAGDISSMASTSRGKKSNMKAPPTSSLSTATIGTNGIEDTFSSGEESEANNVNTGMSSYSGHRWELSKNRPTAAGINVMASTSSGKTRSSSNAQNKIHPSKSRLSLGNDNIVDVEAISSEEESEAMEDYSGGSASRQRWAGTFMEQVHCPPSAAGNCARASASSGQGTSSTPTVKKSNSKKSDSSEPPKKRGRPKKVKPAEVNAKNSCAICKVEGGKMVTISCGHYYHEPCIRSWVVQRKKKVCPLCQEIFSDKFYPRYG